MTEVIKYLTNLFEFNEATQKYIIAFGVQVAFFLFFVFLSLLIGHYTPFLVRLIIQKVFPKQVASIYENLITPLEDLFRITGTLILISICLSFLSNYKGIYNFLQFFLDLSVISSFAWLCSRLFRQFVRFYGIDLIRKLGRQVDELLLVVKTIANVIIGFFAIIAFCPKSRS